MRLDRAQQTQQAAEAQSQEQRAGGGGHKGFAGGSHKGTTYRHAPRAQPPARRNTGPAPKAKPRPQANARPAGHPEDEHAQMPPDDPQQQRAGAAAFKPINAAGGGQQSGDASDRQQAAGLTSPARARRPPPSEQVHEGAALRQSRQPAAARLLAPPAPNGMPAPALFEALAAVYFGAAGAPSSTRLAAMAAVARHLAPDSAAPTMADIKAAVMSWCESGGKPRASTEADRNANLLFPVHALRALFKLPEGPQAMAANRNELLQRATLPSPQDRRP